MQTGIAALKCGSLLGYRRLPGLSRQARFLPVRCASPSNGAASSSSDASSATKAKVINTEYFSRPQLEALFLKRLVTAPKNILLLLGPRNCGKSALLARIVRVIKGRPYELRVSFLDARRDEMVTPAGLAQSLAEGSSGWLELSKLLKGTAGVVLQASNFNFKGPGDVETFDLRGVLAAFVEVVKNGDSGVVLVIDEVNKLEKWTAEHADALDTVLSFLVWVSKQEGKAQVVLATSDSAFVDWLHNRIGPTFFETRMVGDFPKEQARDFLKHVRPSLTDDLLNAHFERIYEVCGGNAGALKSWAVEYNGDVEEALFEVGKAVGIVVRNAFKRPPVGWTSAQYAVTVRALRDSPYGAVMRDVLEEQLGPGGEQAMLAMLKDNLLGLRPGYSNWAQDVPQTAFGGQEDAELITAATSIHMFKMRQLQLPDEVASGATTSGPVIAVGLELLAVGDAICKVVGKLEEVEDEVKQLKRDRPDGWQQEVSELLEDKIQLRKREEQLRKREEQLREKELMLLRRSQ